jgi:uncharacterized protein YndB with AHSA1/START domain
MRVEASGILLAPPEDVWAIVGEPFRLPDWLPGYRGVEPDRRGLAEGARWRVVRGGATAGTTGLLRRPGGEGAVVVGQVVPGRLLRFRDLQQRLDARVTLEPAARRRTQVTVAIEAPAWRIAAEGLRTLPRQAVSRLHDLCQTGAEL